jgi:glycerophosphoryl diester phosphodiesterase
MVMDIDEIIRGFNRPVIIAHRGASFYSHENTMEAFEAAVEMHAEMIEFDVRRTKDEVLVIHHDEDVNEGLITDMSYTQLSGTSDVTDYRIPALVDVLEFCKNRILLDIELKEPGYEEQILQTVLGIMTSDHFIITSTYEMVLRKIKALYPIVRTGMIIGSRPRHQLLAKLYPKTTIRRTGADVVVVSRKLLKFGFLYTTRNLDLPVWIYTINDRKEMWKHITDERIGAVFTDRPDVGLFLRDLYVVQSGQITQEKTTV